MMLEIYIGTIIFFWAALIAFKLDIKRRLKILNLYTKNIKLITYSFKQFMQFIILSIVPIINICFGLLLIFSDDLLDDNIKRYKQLHKEENK